MRIGISEIIVIVVVALALIRPDKLREYVRGLSSIAKTINEEKKKVETEIIDPIKDDVDTIKNVV